MAGGKSSRMGADKAFVPLLGKPLIEHALGSVSGLGDEQIIITNNPDPFRYLELPLYADIYQGCGPLGGLHAALARASHRHLLVVDCDMPWLNRDLLEYMVSLRQTADIVVPRWTRFPEPLHAVYSKACLEPVAASLEAKTLKLIAFYRQVKVRYLDREVLASYDVSGRSFANINTPKELLEAGNKK
jgi:molybdopterin-guanine dinucleotide biosynthesis protein A